MKKHFTLSFVLISSFLLQVGAQNEEEKVTPTFNWKGFTHIWASHVQQDNQDANYGFTIRYLRLKAYGVLTKDIKWTAQFSFDKGNPAILDVHLTYAPESYLKLRVGQFPVPGAKSGVFSSALWSTTKMKFNDRATVTQNWASNAGLSGYRSGGAMVFGDILDKKLHYYVMAAMPVSGSGNYLNASVKNPVYGSIENGLAMYSRIEFNPMKEIETGVNFHVGKGVTDDTNTTKRMSYTLYFLMRKGPISAMVEYIGGKNEYLINDNSIGDLVYNGYLLELGYKMAEKYEPSIRYDYYKPNDGNADGYGYESYSNLTLGFNYYPMKSIAIMFNYVLRFEKAGSGFEEIDNNMAYLQLRYFFPQNK